MAAKRSRQRTRTYRRRSSRFALGLLLYFGLMIAAFALVWRYMPRLAERVGHIQFGWLRFSIYFVVYVSLTLGINLALRRVPLGLRREGQLRLCFAVATTLSVAVAIYQARF